MLEFEESQVVYYRIMKHSNGCSNMILETSNKNVLEFTFCELNKILDSYQKVEEAV